MQRVLLLLLCGLLAPPAHASSAWLAPSIQKILKDRTPAEPMTTLALEAVRNEWVAFQVVVEGGLEGLEVVNVTVGDLQGADGGLIQGAAADRSLAYYVHLDFASPCDLWHPGSCGAHEVYERVPGLYPDALVPFVDPYDPAHPPVAAPFDVAAGDRQVVFVDWLVPADAPPGDYGGEVVVSAGGEPIATLSLSLLVWDVTLPAERTVATSFGFGPKELWKYHGGPEPPADQHHPDDEARARILDAYEQVTHRHRVDWRGYDHGLDYEDFVFDEGGQVASVDTASFEAIMGSRLDGSRYEDGAAINRFDLGRFCPGRGTGPLTDEQYGRAAAWLADYLEEKGWRDQVFLYSTDEPWMPAHEGAVERIAEDLEKLYAISDVWRPYTLVTGPILEPLDGDIGIWCPVTPMYDDTFWTPGMYAPPETYEAHVDAGGELWLYVCNANFPPQLGYDVDSPLGWEPRLLKWGAWWEGATGFLYWRMTYWRSEQPWDVLVNLESFGELFSRNGDGILIYPGDHAGSLAPQGSPPWVALDGPVVSYRLKQVRDGMEDWELFRLAEAAGIGDYARAQVETTYRAFGQPIDEAFDIGEPPWTLDGERMLAARRAILAKLQWALHPARYPDPEAPEPDPDPQADATDATADSGPDDRADAVVEATPSASSGGGCAAGQTARRGMIPTLLLLGLLGLLALALGRRVEGDA